MPVSAARAAAFDILLRVERESSYATELLHSKNYEKLSTADHALTTELVMGVLRWRLRLDDEIAQASSQPLKRLDVEILIALRLALYQFQWLTRIPQRAAVNESVELVKRARKKSAAPFVNAILRKLSAKPALLTDSSQPSSSFTNSAAESDSVGAIATASSHPVWLVERWAKEYGLSAVLKICQHDQSIPTTTIRIRKSDVANELTKQGIQLVPGELLSTARRVESGDITQTQAFRNHAVVIQDEASQLVAALISQVEGKDARILDCCAAPGGKTLAIADAHPNAEITAVELHPHRAQLMQRLWGASANRIRTVVADVRALAGSAPYDRILADVPCSGTGTLSRNPEIKWRLRPDDLGELQQRQLGILRSALKHLSPGGRLVYSTCSLEKKENEDVIDQVLAEETSVRLLDCGEELKRLKEAGQLTWPDPKSLIRGPYLRTIPGVHPCDGFFAAILGRV